VRARKEEFGLLFYRSRDAKLTFVKSGDLLQADTNPDGVRLIRARYDEGQAEQVSRLFSALLRKGLVLEP